MLRGKDSGGGSVVGGGSGMGAILDRIFREGLSDRVTFLVKTCSAGGT